MKTIFAASAPVPGRFYGLNQRILRSRRSVRCQPIVHQADRHPFFD
jgi:hypothetical protein